MILNKVLITVDQSPALNLVLYEWQNWSRLNRMVWVADVKLQMFTNTKTISYDHLRACQWRCQRGQTYWGVYQSLINKRLKHARACAHTPTHKHRDLISLGTDADSGCASQLVVWRETTHCSKTDREHGFAYSLLILVRAQ